ncbi:HlyC/CorC family transporter [bacterium]|jgi:putative hemolysin|nr:HlyC/CorC family transporter [bacterium]MBT6832303.1 HlyC/CorC family transporter [bacterium]MBT6996028.1 HlyC/CorC family transporter [bacterium]MBT7772319.1 HlyC/CorC family transporter [bacterium]
MDKLPILFLLLALSGFFSGAEIALFSLGPEKIQALKNRARTKKEKLRVARLEALKSDSEKLLVTILIGNNVVNVAASAMATLVALRFGEKMGFGSDANLVIGIVTGVMTLLILIFGEITPKAIAHRYALRFSLFAAPILKFLGLILWPIVTPIAILTKKFSGSAPRLHGLSEDELKAAIELSEKEGQIDADEKELFERVLEFDEHAVETIMTPRSKIFSLPDNMPVPDALKEIAENGFSRIPIFHENSDNVTGILKVQSLVDEFLKPDFKKKKLANLSLLAPMKIPLTMKIDTLLREFQKEKTHLALVLDEHGSLIGLITLEDVLEEIFGEFEDEQDEQLQLIHRTGKNIFECHAEIELEQIENFVKESLGRAAPRKNWPWTLEEENKTLSYFLLEKLERFPALGEKIKIEENGRNFSFVVKKSDDERMEIVELSLS